MIPAGSKVDRSARIDNCRSILWSVRINLRLIFLFGFAVGRAVGPMLVHRYLLQDVCKPLTYATPKNLYDNK